MPADSTDFAGLVERYRTLGAADRKAVRRNLSSDECRAIERAEAEIDRARRSELTPERQFRGYSPWLAALIDQVLGGDRAPPELTAECRAAIASSHLSIVEDQGEETLIGRIGRLLGIAGLGGGAAGNSQC
jgi:hypothetical protein